MCFSPGADVAGAVVVGAIGMDALRHVTHRRDLPLASLPLLFAGHFFIETFVWLANEGVVSQTVGSRATWAYLVIALAVIPTAIPAAVTLAEPDGRRRTLMTVLSVLGFSVGAVLLVAVVRGPLDAAVQGHHIAYAVPLDHGGQLTALYVVATCGVLLASRYRPFLLFGIVNLIVVGLLAWLMASAFISLWCAWAALTSVAIAAHLRQTDPSSHSPDRIAARTLHGDLVAHR